MSSGVIIFFEDDDGGFGIWMAGLERDSTDGSGKLFCASSTALMEGTGAGF
jgi:hypothetical protein